MLLLTDLRSMHPDAACLPVLCLHSLKVLMWHTFNSLTKCRWGTLSMHRSYDPLRGVTPCAVH